MTLRDICTVDLELFIICDHCNHRIDTGCAFKSTWVPGKHGYLRYHVGCWEVLGKPRGTRDA